MLTPLIHALKEWDIAVNALEKGQTILLLRKGGIREAGGHFKINYNPILLYPTYEHQKPDLLKSAYQTSVTPVPSGWHPDTIPIKSWANITKVFQIQESVKVNLLLPYHIWTEKFAEERFNWQPGQPLFLLLLRVYLLPKPVLISYSDKYGGCRSWIQLNHSIILEGSQEVFNDADYDKKVAEIETIL
ncbi:DUF1802 family protein [Crocosphaera sp. UHCC 0190]|uniref:DUF1802 family protein n=1 Tax=Crocosphaera sp. UHCC 0190 TaxID=3110246 RepID=UPI002B1F1563|nr:DUF1802 family protein [Crocosphaera sp. UHCC 0190]MEA5511193.1 DUF1802 family protein [Crocosphaera sp. UHCC 0190]